MNTFDVLQPLFGHLIGDAFGTQLLVKIFLPPQLHHPLDVAGARAECDAIEQVRNLLLFGQFFRGVTLRRRLGALLFLTLRLLGRPNRRAKARRNQKAATNLIALSDCLYIDSLPLTVSPAVREGAPHQLYSHQTPPPSQPRIAATLHTNANPERLKSYRNRKASV